jgi:D-serine deaminase-like pyridoxal phosphate-dependent protein
VLGDESISILVDHPDTFDFTVQSYGLWPGRIPIFVKIDTGYHRSGISTTSALWRSLLDRIKMGETEGTVCIIGLYSHFGHSYDGNTPSDALTGLKTEFESLAHAAKEMDSSLPRGRQLTFSVGATPTATAAQAFFGSAESNEVRDVTEYLKSLQKSGEVQLELHAGVYPLLDMQQLATHASPSNLSYNDLGLRILAEIASLYPDRSKPEALIAAGTLVLGREPCKSYPGWGVVTPWPHSNPDFPIYDEQKKSGWIVGRVSQEHGILSWEGPTDGKRELHVGGKVLVWPNHACMAGVGFGWYYVVDSDEDEEDVVRDVWVRCRGW